MGQKETVRRDNVLRCKIYRDKKKNEQKEGEGLLKQLSEKNNELVLKESILDRTIKTLRQKYIEIVKKGNECDSCSDDCSCESDDSENEAVKN